MTDFMASAFVNAFMAPLVALSVVIVGRRLIDLL
jgi:hypothetical protein